jgi:hypothetical protein
MDVAPINLVALSAVVLGCLIVLIPVSLLTLRYAIKPIAEALATSRQGSSEKESVQMLERRVALLEQQLHGMTELRGEMSRVLEEMDFQKQLKRG